MLTSYSLDLGGSERQLTEVAKALDPARFEVHVGCQIAQGIRVTELVKAGIPIAEFPMRSYASPDAVRAAFQLARYIRRHGIELVHAFDVSMDVFAVPVARAAGCRIVLSSQRAHRELTTGLRLPLLRFTDRLVNGIVVNCEHIRRHLIQDEDVSPDRIHLCYNGLDLEQFPVRADRTGETLTLGTICALRPEKNLPLLLRAFKRLRDGEAQRRLMIIGGGPQEAELKKLASDLDLGSSMEFIPATRDVPHWLQQIDIFVLPSRSEALSNSLMEAMACGCAVVASDVGGNPELTGAAGERGLLFPTEDEAALVESLEKLLKDPNLRARLGFSAAHFIRGEMSIESSVNRMAQIYSSFLER
jgi:glycosyltransferase involved in cell wall biosynthesis